MQTRRALLRSALLLAGAALLPACGSKVATGSTEDFLGDAHAPGDPVWSERPPAYLVAFTAPELARVQRTQPAALLETIVGGLAALAPDCPHDGTTVGYCSAARLFVCPTCSSAFDRWGHVVDGPSTRGLSHRPLELLKDQLVVRSGGLVPGAAADTLRPDGTRGTVDGAAGRCTGRITFPPSLTGGSA